jgi:DNA-binding transcriptional LysR family regulator
MVLKNVDANLLVALHALLGEKNVTRAAKRVGREQSSMSHALARLRDHFGDPLLVPAGRGMALTERAESLVGPVDAAIAQLERVFTANEPFDPRTSSRTFQIATTDNLELYLLPKLVALLADEAPGVDLRFYHLANDWRAALVRGDLDLKLGRGYELPSGFHAEDLLEERLVGVVREGHAFVGERLSLAEYTRLAHIVVSPAAEPGSAVRAGVDTILEQRGLARRIAVAVPHFLVAPHVVAGSDLVLTVSERLIAPFLGPLDLRIVELPIKLRAYALTQVWAERAHHDPSHRFLRAVVRRALSGEEVSTASMGAMPTIHDESARPALKLRYGKRTGTRRSKQ